MQWHSVEILCLNSVLEPAVYLKSKYKVYYNNNSMISISDIGEGDDALLCITNLRDCCKNIQTHSGIGALGEWFYPNGDAVAVETYSYRGFYKDRDQSVVRLHRREDGTAPIGQFCCKVPDATYEVVTICIDMSNSNDSESDISSPTLASGDEYCKQTPTSTASQQPVTSIPLTTEG